MIRLLLVGLFPILVVAPHLVPIDPPVAVDPPESRIGLFADDGKSLPNAEELERLAETKPIAFLEACMRRHTRDVKGYTLTFHKQERINGHLEGKEVIDISFREDPHAVLMVWKKGSRLASKALWASGENKDEKTDRAMALIKPSGLGGRFVKSVLRDPNGPEAKKSGRYPINEFGLKGGLERTLNAWKEDKDLHVKYLGKQKVDDVGGRTCFVFKRDGYKSIENDGKTVQTEQIAYIDVETWIMVGSVLRSDKGELIGEYLFRDIRLNPEFAKDLFTKKSIEN